MVKYNGFVTFFSHLFSFFRFLGQPTGRNFGPICRLNGSKDVFRSIHVPFQGLLPSNLQKNSQIWTRKSLDSRLHFEKKTVAIFYYSTNHRQIY